MASAGSIWTVETDPAAIEPFEFWRGPRGVLLLHGFAGTPPEVLDLGRAVAAVGYSALGPILAGHGSTPQEMAGTRWGDWVGSAQAALERLRSRAPRVYVGGQSMGALIALYLAAHDPAVQGVIACATPLYLSDWRVHLLPVARYAVRYYEDRRAPDLGDPTRVSRLHSYRHRPTVCIQSLVALGRLVRGLLPRIRCPVLILHGRNDRLANPRNARYVYDHIGSADRRLVVLERSGHAVTVDWESDRVEATVVRWLSEHA